MEETAQIVVKNENLYIYLLIVSPEDVVGRLGSVLDEAGQIDGAADVDVHLGPAQDDRRRLCETKEKLILFFFFFSDTLC